MVIYGSMCNLWIYPVEPVGR